MSWLNNQVLYTIINSSLKCLIYIIDFFTISCLYMVNDDLCRECSSYRPIRICCLNCFLDTTDVCYTAVIERCTKTYNKNLIFSNLILIQRIIFGRITCISSEIIRISIFTFY